MHFSFEYGFSVNLICLPISPKPMVLLTPNLFGGLHTQVFLSPECILPGPATLGYCGTLFCAATFWGYGFRITLFFSRHIFQANGLIDPKSCLGAQYTSILEPYMPLIWTCHVRVFRDTVLSSNFLQVCFLPFHLFWYAKCFLPTFPFLNFFEKFLGQILFYAF